MKRKLVWSDEKNKYSIIPCSQADLTCLQVIENAFKEVRKLYAICLTQGMESNDSDRINHYCNVIDAVAEDIGLKFNTDQYRAL